MLSALALSCLLYLYAHTHTHTVYTHTLEFFSQFLTLPHTSPLTNTHCSFLPPFLFPVSHSPSHTHTHTHTHSPSHTHTHTHTQTLSCKPRRPRELCGEQMSWVLLEGPQQEKEPHCGSLEGSDVPTSLPLSSPHPFFITLIRTATPQQ